MVVPDGAADASGCPGRISSTVPSRTTTVVWIRARRRVHDSGDHPARSVSAPGGGATSSPGILGG